MRKIICYIVILCCALLAGGCGQAADEAGEELVVYSPHPQSFIQPLVDEFEGQTGISVRIVTGGTGELLERIAQEQPGQADVLWGGSISKVSEQRALFAVYHSPEEEMLLPQFRNEDGRMTPFTNVPSVLLVNTNLLGNMEIRGYKDLLNKSLAGRIAFADPAASSSSYAHLLNMLAVMGKEEPEDGWKYIRKFCRNLNGRLLADSQEVSEAVAKGKCVAGCTFEEAALYEVAQGRPVKIVYMQEGVVSEPDGMYILKNTRHERAAQAFVDFMLSRRTQQYIVNHLRRRSVRQDVAVPAGGPELLSIGEQAGWEVQGELLARFRQYYEAVSEGRE